MKLKTSYFNSSVLKKDITRFAPVWGLYTVFMLMTLFLIWADENEPARFAANAQYVMQLMGIVNFAYGGLCAVLLFGDLFKSRMCNALHAMPLRREGWFLTHLTAGLLFCLVPNALGAVLSCIILQEYCYLAFLWLGIMVLQYLFFFGAGVFSAQCAGNLLGATAVYGLFNFLAVLSAFLVITFYAPVLYGVEVDVEQLCRYSPVVGFSMSGYVSVDYDNMAALAIFEGFQPEAWRYLFIAAGVGLALLGTSVMLYRRRQLESAGDFMAVKPAAPVFLVIYTLCVGAVLYFIADTLSTDAEYVFLLIGFAIGFFTGWMLLEKKVNVFQPKKFLGFGVLTLVFFLTISVTWMDPAGITRYVPESGQVQSVRISPYTSDYYMAHESLLVTDPEQVADIIQMHSQMVKTRTGDRDSVVRLHYTLKNGTTVERKYPVDSAGEIGQQLKKYYSSRQCVLGSEDPLLVLRGAYYLEFNSYTTELPNVMITANPDEDQLQQFAEKYDGEMEVLTFQTKGYLREDPVVAGLFDAVAKDCDAGTMAQQWEYHSGKESVGSIYVSINGGGYLDFVIFEDCVNTIAYLKSLTS